MTDDTQKQVAETVARLREDAFYGDARLYNMNRHNPLHMESADLLEALAARMAEVTADRDSWKTETVHWQDTAAAVLTRAEAAEARVTELEALLAAYQDQTVPDLTAVYIAGGMDRRDEVARLRTAQGAAGVLAAMQDDRKLQAMIEAQRAAEPTHVDLVVVAVITGAFLRALAAPQPTATKETKDE